MTFAKSWLFHLYCQSVRPQIYNIYALKNAIVTFHKAQIIFAEVSLQAAAPIFKMSDILFLC